MGVPWRFRLARIAPPHGHLALQRQIGDRVQEASAWLPARAASGRIARQSILDFHLRDHRSSQLLRRFLTEPRRHGPFSWRAKSLSTLVSSRYFTKRRRHAVTAIRRDKILERWHVGNTLPFQDQRRPAGLPSAFLSSHSRSALRISPLRVSPSFLAVRSNSLAV